MFKMLFSICLWLGLVMHSALAVELPLAALPPRTVLPAEGTHPWGTDPLKGLKVQPHEVGKLFLQELEPASHGTGLPTVLELRTEQGFPGATYALQLVLPNREPLKKGSTIFVEFYVRLIKTKTESGEGLTKMDLCRNGPPWTMTITKNITAPGDGSWALRTYSGTPKEDYAPGEAKIAFDFNYPHPQTIQLAGLRAVDLGPAVGPKSLPNTSNTYSGREASAPWRAEAAERIEKFRKGDLAIRVVNAAGQPVPMAAITVKMTKPDFAFGSAVASDFIMQQSPDGERYREWIQKNCSRVVIENHVKPITWQYDKKTKNESTLKSLAWLNEKGLEIKGHTLVWPSWEFSPKRFRDLAGDPAALKKAYDDHIIDLLSATAPYKLVEWDVVNESYTQRDILDVLGNDVMTDWFKLARQHFPKGGLFGSHAGRQTG